MRIDSSTAGSAAYDLPGRPTSAMDGVLNPPQAGAVRHDGAAPAETAAETKARIGNGERVADLADPILDELVEAINRNLNAVDKRLQFLVHEASGRVQLRVLERSTEEVIREVPPEQLLDLIGRIHDLIGLLVDESA